MKSILRSTLLTSTLLILTPLSAYGQSPQPNAPIAERKVAPGMAPRPAVSSEQRMQGNVVAFDKATRLATVALSDGRRLTLPIAGTEEVPLGISFIFWIKCTRHPPQCEFGGSIG